MYDVLIDAGPQRQVLSCLGKHMPFYDRTIELAIFSHSEIDHFGGFIFLLDRYK
jgi:competence protein ComEC